MIGCEHEEIIVLNHEQTGLHAIVAIHDTARGPGRGGTRIKEYRTPMDAMDDALVLSYQMTLKLAFYGFPYGGAKAVIIDDETGRVAAVRKRRLEAFARSLNRYKDRFSTGPDLGVNTQDLQIMRRLAENIIGHDEDMGQLMIEATAHGVLAALDTAWGESLEERPCSILGVGKLGSKLAELLSEKGAKLILADSDTRLAKKTAEKYDGRAVDVDDLFDEEVDVFLPCATGGVITEMLVPRLRCKAICGAANQQLAHDEYANNLRDAGILYVPDFVANVGATFIALESSDDEPADRLTKICERIRSEVKSLMEAADESGHSLHEEALLATLERVRAARRKRAKTQSYSRA